MPHKIWNKTYICASIMNFLLCVTMFMINPLVANYSKLLGADEILIGFLSGLYFGVAFAARPFSGFAGAVLNKKNVMLAGYALGFVVNISYAISSSIPAFMAARAMHGFQLAFVGSLNLTMASLSLPPEKMGSGLGLFGVGGATANAIAPGVGIALRSFVSQTTGDLKMGYAAVFLLAAACMLICIVPCALMPYDHPSKEELSKLGLWYKNIFAKESLLWSAVSALLSAAVITYTVFIERFAEAKGIGNIGLFFIVYASVLITSRPFFGRLMDKYGPAMVFIPGSLIFALSFVIICFSNSLTVILACAVFAGAGSGAWQPTVQSMCLLSVNPLRYGVASNTHYFGVDFGFFFGSVIGGVIISRFGFQNNFSFSNGYTIIYSPLYIFMVIPVLISIALFALGYGAYRRNAIKAQAYCSISTATEN